MPENKQPKDSSGRVPLPTISRKSMKSGLINEGSVSENERPETSVSESLNFHFDAIGSATIRKGYTILGNNLGGAILGMHYHVDTVAGTQSRLIVVAGTSAYYLSGGTYVAKRTSLTENKARFATYLNYVFMVNGAEATAVWDGTTGNAFVTTGNAQDAPIGKYIESFRGRMWIAGNPTYPDRLYYSSIPTSVASPVITWDTDPDTTLPYFIWVSPNDGDTITGIQRFRQWMIVFKTNRLYRVFDIGQVDPDPYYAVGTSSQESVVETKVGVFFHHSTGIFQFDINGIVQEVSRPIWDIIRAVPATQYANVTGWLEADGDHVVWCLGDVTIKGIIYNNLHVRYTLSTQVWTHYSYANNFVMSIRRQPFYVNGANMWALAGDSLGNVMMMNNGNTDNGTSILYSLIHRWDNVDGFLSTRKTLMTGNFSHYGGTGGTVAFQTEDNVPDAMNDWTRKVGKGILKPTNTGFNAMDIKARKVRFRIFGESKGTPFEYNGYELFSAVNEFMQFT